MASRKKGAEWVGAAKPRGVTAEGELADVTDAEADAEAEAEGALMGAFFGAAAHLYRAKPWTQLPARALFSFSSPAVGLETAVVSILGRRAGDFGLVLFETPEDFDAYLEAAEAAAPGEEQALPEHLVITYEKGATLGAELRKEIADAGWDVAGANAYPWVARAGKGVDPEDVSARDYAIGELLARTLSALVADAAALRGALEGGEPYAKTLSIAAHLGDAEVVVRAPFEPGTTGMTGEIRAAHAKLIARFGESRHMKKGEANAAELVTSLALDGFEKFVTELDPADVRRLVFDLIPEKVVAEPAAAAAMLGEIRTFFTFLEEEGAPAAKACLAVLDDRAAEKLAKALGDKSKFGPMKAMIVAGRAAGFDMNTTAGVEAFMRQTQGGALVPPPSQGETVRRAGAKVGPNDPCPCGSGKKHKKCCRA